MGGTTPNYGFRYPSLVDPPNVPQDTQNLATDVDTALAAEASSRLALAATQDASGRGRIGSCSYSTVGATVTTEVMLNTFTVTCVAGRRYRAFISGSGNLTTGGTSITDALWFIVRYQAGGTCTVAGGTAFAEMMIPIGTLSDARSKVHEFISPGSGTYTFGLSAAHPSGSNTCTIVPNSLTPCQLAIDDIGT